MKSIKELKNGALSSCWTEDLTSTEYHDGLRLRYEVFVEEQGFDPDTEVYSESCCLHMQLYENNSPDRPCVGTVRIYNEIWGETEWGEKKLVKGPPRVDTLTIQRVAVRKEARGKGYGAILIEECERMSRELKAAELKLEAQVHAIGFYENLGFEVRSEVYIEEGIEHRTMIKTL